MVFTSGKFAINLGLITNIEKEKNTFGMNRSFTLEEKIAGVLSHEITHSPASHGGRTIELRCFLLSIFKVMELSAKFFLCKPVNNEIKELEKIEDKTDEQILKIAQLQKRRETISNRVFTIFDYIIYRWVLMHCTFYASRSYEFEADKYGMHLIHKIGSEHNKLGFNKSSAESAVWLQHYFKQAHPQHFTGWLGKILNVLATHPSSEERLVANEKTWEALKTA